MPTEPEESHSLPSDELTKLDAGICAAFADDNADFTLARPHFSQQGETVASKYKLIEQIGEGGMGTVWYAEQFTPVKRKVALKLIKPGMDSRTVLARFDAERQALALMDHPNIAKVLDAGMTEQDRPYFVMELVKGTPITTYCDERKLDLRARLELFGPVCHAIQHAHQKGIIHRDIKPTNVMVALYDDKAIPIVIDFGVAKATGATLTEQSLHTGFDVMIGTPEYMSPEQAHLNNLDVDTRSDVYSLGVLLYELLAGSPPFRGCDLEKKGLIEMFRVIREDNPPLPSIKLSTSNMRASIAAVRSIEPDALGRLLRTDLDWIVMKALEKDRTRRYATANALARDIERFLREEEVEARPPSTAYRLQKMLVRHHGLIVAIALMLVLLAAGTAVSTWQAIRATRASQIAANNETRATTNETKATNAAEREAAARKDELKQRHIAESRQRDAEQAKKEIEHQRDLAVAARYRTRQALDSMTSTLANTYLARQNTISEEQKLFLAEVLTYYSDFVDDPQTDEMSAAMAASAANRVAWIQQTLGNNEATLAAYQLAVDRYSKLHEEHPDVAMYATELANSLNNLAYVLANFGRQQQSFEVYQRAIDLQMKILERNPGSAEEGLSLARLQHNLGLQLRDQGRYEDSHKLFSESKETCLKIKETFPDAPRIRYELAMVEASLGLMESDRGIWEESKTLLNSSRKRLEKLRQDDSENSLYATSLAWCLNNFGIQLAFHSEFPEAEECFKSSIDILEQLVTQYPSASEHRIQLTIGYHQFAAMLTTRQQFDDAHRMIDNGIQHAERLVRDNPDSVDCIWENGEVKRVQCDLLLAEKKLDEAVTAVESCLDSWVGLWKKMGDSAKLYDSRLTRMRFTVAMASGLDPDPNKAAVDWLLVEQIVDQQYPGDQGKDDRQTYLTWMLCVRVNNAVTADRVENAIKFLESSFAKFEGVDRAMYNLGCAHALVVAGLKADDPRREQQIHRAIEFLKRATDQGWSNVEHARDDSDLDALRNEYDFQDWLNSLSPSR